jgi:ClpX C4-type zinc finger
VARARRTDLAARPRRGEYSPGSLAAMQDPSHHSDVTCSFCGRHNREVRVVSNDAGLIICQVCVAKCAEIFDAEVGLVTPSDGWTTRWPFKR